jgi:hypothetical protein
MCLLFPRVDRKKFDQQTLKNLQRKIKTVCCPHPPAPTLFLNHSLTHVALKKENYLQEERKKEREVSKPKVLIKSNELEKDSFVVRIDGFIG